jgi:hypothetical protein
MYDEERRDLVGLLLWVILLKAKDNSSQFRKFLANFYVHCFLWDYHSLANLYQVLCKTVSEIAQDALKRQRIALIFYFGSDTTKKAMNLSIKPQRMMKPGFNWWLLKLMVKPNKHTSRNISSNFKWQRANGNCFLGEEKECWLLLLLLLLLLFCCWLGTLIIKNWIELNWIINNNTNCNWAYARWQCYINNEQYINNVYKQWTIHKP